MSYCLVIQDFIAGPVETPWLGAAWRAR